jgi:tRNA nucleotidyltransferase (CCA-adding enzyme)
MENFSWAVEDFIMLYYSKMTDKIPQHIIEIVKKFSESGFEIYLVGGSVRDLLHKREVADWDLTTNATPAQVQDMFPDSVYENNFGTVGIKTPDISEAEHKGLVEVTTFRTEKDYTDRRHPAVVEWGKSVEEDLQRRDFTINAMALDLESRIKNQELRIIDPFGGRDDLKNKVIKAVGDPALRFKEDALRLMRAIRFATQLGFSIEERTLQEIQNDAVLLAEIATERVREELIKILASEYPYEGVMLLKNTGLLGYILPELLEGIGISQVRPGRHHTDDVFTHNVLSLKHTPAKDPIVRFATLVHDIGKPRVRSEDEEGLVIFYNHEIAGAKIARDIAVRLRFSKKETEKITKLVRWHMFTVDEKITDSAVRRFIRRIGVENVSDMMDLRVGDRLGGGTQTAESWRLKLFKKRLEEQMAPAPFSINDLAIDGRDVMKELNIKPGPKVGEILQKLFEEVDEDLEKNNKEFLLKRLKEI